MRGIAIILVFSTIIAFAPSAFGQDDANLRVTHLSPDAGEVDVYVDGAIFREYLGYERTTEYLNLSAGSHQIDVYPAGFDQQSLSSISIFIDPGSSHTIGISGLLTSNDLRLISNEDELDTGLRFALVRFVHSSPGVGPIDIAIAGGPVLVSGLPYRESSGYLEVRPTVYDLEVRVAGTDTVLYQISDIGLTRAAACTIYTAGTTTDETLITVHTFEANHTIDPRQILLGLAFWAALLAWFVQNHAS
jgi:hypothetical protein